MKKFQLSRFLKLLQKLRNMRDLGMAISNLQTQNRFLRESVNSLFAEKAKLELDIALDKTWQKSKADDPDTKKPESMKHVESI